MTEFMRKTLGGLPTSEEDWNEHLLAYHRLTPGATPRALASYRTAEGSTSYDLLVDVAARAARQRSRPLRLLDLACGDGYLIELCLKQLGGGAQITGVDMSEAERAAARERLRGQDMVLLQERAQSLSLADESVDVALSHMAFMLLHPVEPVVSEIARVLAPGGLFSAVIGPARLGPVGSHADGVAESQAALAQAVNGLMDAFWQEEFPQMRRPSINNPRVMSQAGLTKLFNRDLGYDQPVTVKDVDLIIDTSVDGLWDYFAATYVVAFLQGDALQRLESRMKALFAEHREVYEALQLPLPLSQITVHKQGV